MKFENFDFIEQRDIKSSGLRDWVSVAEVDVTTGVFRKKTERLRVCKNRIGFNWYFEETGKFTPGLDVENLARAYTAKTGREL